MMYILTIYRKQCRMEIIMYKNRKKTISILIISSMAAGMVNNITCFSETIRKKYSYYV